MWKLSLRREWVACLFAIAATATTSAIAADSGSLKNPGITNPSEMRGLNFNVPGVVSKVIVKEGDAVTKGQLIAQQDDSVDQADLKVKEADVVSSSLQIDAANVDLAQKKVELARDQEMFKKGVMGQSDLDKAKLDVDIGAIRVKLAEQETSQKRDEVNAEKAKIAQKQLYSTIQGIVQKINVHEGELATNDPKTPCIQVVLNEPLYVEVDVPVDLAAGLKLGEAMDVRYMRAGETKWQDAQIIYFNPVANAAAGMQRVRLQMDNPNHLRSGLMVEVTPQDPAHNKGVAVVQPGR